MRSYRPARPARAARSSRPARGEGSSRSERSSRKDNNDRPRPARPARRDDRGPTGTGRSTTGRTTGRDRTPRDARPDDDKRGRPSSARSGPGPGRDDRSLRRNDQRRTDRDQPKRPDARQSRFNGKPTPAPGARAARAAHTPGAENRSAAARLRIDLYGRHAVLAAWLNPERRVMDLYVCDQSTSDEFAHAAQLRGLVRPGPRLIPREDLDRALPRGSVHQGVGLRCAPLADLDLDDLLRGADNRPYSCFVMLDQVTDPHNVGAILRSVSALGAHGVIVQKQNAPSVTAVLAKTACGAVESVPMVPVTNLSRALDILKESGFHALGLDERGATGIETIPAHDRLVLVLGAEGDGLRRLVSERCNQLVRLPTGGEIASLNVSNAAAVALYAVHVSRTASM